MSVYDTSSTTSGSSYHMSICLFILLGFLDLGLVSGELNGISILWMGTPLCPPHALRVRACRYLSTNKYWAAGNI